MFCDFCSIMCLAIMCFNRRRLCYLFIIYYWFIFLKLSEWLRGVTFFPSSFQKSHFSQCINIWKDVFEGLLHTHKFNTSLNKDLDCSCSFNPVTSSRGAFVSHDLGVCFPVIIYACVRTRPIHEAKMSFICLFTPFALLPLRCTNVTDVLQLLFWFRCEIYTLFLLLGIKV